MKFINETLVLWAQGSRVLYMPLILTDSVVCGGQQPQPQDHWSMFAANALRHKHGHLRILLNRDSGGETLQKHEWTETNLAAKFGRGRRELLWQSQPHQAHTAEAAIVTITQDATEPITIPLNIHPAE